MDQFTAQHLTKSYKIVNDEEVWKKKDKEEFEKTDFDPVLYEVENPVEEVQFEKNKEVDHFDVNKCTMWRVSFEEKPLFSKLMSQS